MVDIEVEVLRMAGDLKGSQGTLGEGTRKYQTVITSLLLDISSNYLSR